MTDDYDTLRLLRPILERRAALATVNVAHATATVSTTVDTQEGDGTHCRTRSNSGVPAED